MKLIPRSLHKAAARPVRRSTPRTLGAPVAAVAVLAGFGMLGTAGPAFASSTTVVVQPSSLHGWAAQARDPSGNPIAFGDAYCDGSVNFVPGPAAPPLGVGSVELKTGNTSGGGDCSAEVRNSNYAGVKLSSLTALGYWTYDVSNNGQQYPYLELNINQSGTGTSVDDSLFFEPPYQAPGQGGISCADQAPTAMDTWQQWDALNGCWWDNDNFSGWDGGTNTGLLSAYLAAYPNAKVVNSSTGGGVHFVVGFADPDFTYDGNVDAFRIATSGSDTTYDFEPASMGNANCSNETLAPGNYQNVNAGPNCTINGSDHISGNVTVQAGGGLWDQGAPIHGNLQANNATWLAMYSPGTHDTVTIGGNLQVTGLTGEPPGGVAGPGPAQGDPNPYNYLCNTVVNGDVQVQGDKASAGMDIGGQDCGYPLVVGGNLQVQSNAGPVEIGKSVYDSGNAVHNNIQVTNNTGGVTMTDNNAGGNCQASPTVTGSGNTTPAGHTNTCPQ